MTQELSIKQARIAVTQRCEIHMNLVSTVVLDSLHQRREVPHFDLVERDLKVASRANRRHRLSQG